MKRLADNKRNFWLNVFDGALYTMAMAVVPQQTILPAYLSRYTGNEYLINLIPAISVLGFTLPQIFMARHVESRTHRKRMMIITGVFQRIPWLLLGLIVWFFPGVDPRVAIAIFFSLFAMHTFSNGVNIPIWLDLIAKLIPVSQRGRQFAYRSILGGLLGLLGAALSKIVLKQVGFPGNYGTLFLMFFVLTSFSLVFLFFLEEHASEGVREKSKFSEYLRRIPVILAADKNYRRFITSRVILALTGMAGGLIAVYGIEKFGLRGREYLFADISFYSTLACIIPTFVFAGIGDRFGHKINMTIGPIVSLGAMVVLLFTKNETMFVVVFVLQALAMSALSVSSLTMSVEFCGDIDRPTYISVLNTLIAPFSFMAPLIGAFLARAVGYRALFVVVVALQLLYIVYFTSFVKEPRKVGLHR